MVHIFARNGAELLEGHPVKDAKFDKNSGLWTVYLENNEKIVKVGSCIHIHTCTTPHCRDCNSKNVIIVTYLYT